jgi:hypothetical protein
MGSKAVAHLQARFVAHAAHVLDIAADLPVSRNAAGVIGQMRLPWKTTRGIIQKCGVVKRE